MQDWPVEVADAKRVAEFIEIYHAKSLGPDERRALMALILCSFDECDSKNDANWEAIREILLADKLLHAGWIVYWSCVAESEEGKWYFEDEKHCFYTTPRMRELLLELRDDIGFSELDPSLAATPRP
jgi:acyl-CoA synthetase (NDP forming)